MHGIRSNDSPPAFKNVSFPCSPISSNVSRQSVTKAGQNVGQHEGLARIEVRGEHERFPEHVLPQEAEGLGGHPTFVAPAVVCFFDVEYVVLDMHLLHVAQGYVGEILRGEPHFALVVDHGAHGVVPDGLGAGKLRQLG